MGIPTRPDPIWIPGPGEGLEDLDAHLAAFEEMDRRWAEWREAMELFAKQLREQVLGELRGVTTTQEAKKKGPYVVKWKFGKVKVPAEVIAWIIKSEAATDKHAWNVLYESIVNYKPKYFRKQKAHA